MRIVQMVVLFIVALFPLCLSGCDDVGSAPVQGSAAQVTMAQYDRLQSGMTYDEVVQILGIRGQELSRVEIPGTPATVMYGWDARGAIGANMNATFQDGRLVSKAQFGLQ